MPSEFQLIERFLRPFAARGGGVVLGPGDDCAILRTTAGCDSCVTTDAVVEDVHFKRPHFSDAEIGHKALAVNLSDLAAMGASPRWFVCSVACQPRDAARMPAIARGMAALARRAGIVLVGGNFTRAETLSLHITAAGEVPRGRALRRSGARPGQVLYVTGALGEAALGLRLLLAGATRGRALARQRRPEPRLAAGLIARPYATAAIDVSDGLLQDLSHLAQASRVGIRVDAARLPVGRGLGRRSDGLVLALTGGEDYELVLTVPSGRAPGFERAMAAAGERVTRIGEVVARGGVVVENGPRIDRAGFDHFAGARRA